MRDNRLQKTHSSKSSIIILVTYTKESSRTLKIVTEHMITIHNNNKSRLLSILGSNN